MRRSLAIPPSIVIACATRLRRGGKTRTRAGKAPRFTPCGARPVQWLHATGRCGAPLVPGDIPPGDPEPQRRMRPVAAASVSVEELLSVSTVTLVRQRDPAATGGIRLHPRRVKRFCAGSPSALAPLREVRGRGALATVRATRRTLASSAIAGAIALTQSSSPARPMRIAGLTALEQKETA